MSDYLQFVISVMMTFMAIGLSAIVVFIIAIMWKEFKKW